jgi:hypothetical protein
MPDDDQQTDLSRLDDWDKAVLTTLMTDSKGRYWMERLLERCGARSQRYMNDGDALGAAWRDGRASIGDFIETELERFCPDLLLKMIRERRARLGRALKAQEQTPEARKDPQGRTAVEQMADAQREEDEARRAPVNGSAP